MTTLASPRSITLDVVPAAAPTDLRRRLRDQDAASVASLLPGGMILEETAEAVVYRTALPGDWRVAFDGQDVVVTNGEGAVLRVSGGTLSLAFAK